MPAPYVVDWGTNYNPIDILALGPTQLTKLARKFEQFAGDPLAKFFPAEFTSNRTIVIEREIMDLGFTPIINPGQPDSLQPSRRVERMSVFPVYCRESDFIPTDVINDLRAPGTLNEQNGLRVVADRMQQLVNRQNMLWGLLRAQCVLGGINYTDPRTGMSVNVKTGIPTINLVDPTKTRIDPADNNSALVFGGKYWTDAAADLVNDVIKMKRRMANLAKTPPTHMIMTSDLKTWLEMHPIIRGYLQGSGAGNVTGHVTWENGEIKSLAGLIIETFDMIVDDSALTGTGGAVTAALGGTGSGRRKIWPHNKIALIAQNHQLQPGLSLGRTQFAPGEAPDGKPGLWSRSGPDTTPPQPPGRSVQIGNCGLPYVMYPDWIGIMTIADKAVDVETVAGGATVIQYP